MHDDTQPARVFSMAQELSQGIFPVRMVGSLGYGYGYPLFNFYAPLPYYLGAVFYLTGLDLIVATKIMFAVGIIFSGLFMYKLAKEIAGDIYGIVISVFYLYAPYHAVNIYVRGALGEYFAFAFLPLYVLGIYRLFKNDKNYLIPGVLGLAGIFLSHNILGLITFYLSVALFIFLLILYFLKKIPLQIIIRYFLIFILSLGISAFFLFPAFAEKKFTKINTLNSGSNNYKNHFVLPSQLWDSPWGFGGSAIGPNDGMSFKIGKIHLLGAFSAFLFGLYLLYLKKLNNTRKNILFSLISLFSLSIFLMLSGSDMVYRLTPFLDFVQYPWRFLNFVVFSLSLVLFIYIYIKNKFIKYILAGLLIISVIWFNAKYFDVKYIYPLTGKEYLTKANLFSASKISDEYLPGELIPPQSLQDLRSLDSNTDPVKVTVKRNSATLKLFNLVVLGDSDFQTNIAYFPGWEIRDNGKLISFVNKSGFIDFDVNSGIHTLEMKYKYTAIQKISNTISFLTLILILYLAIMDQKLWLKKLHSK